LREIFEQLRAVNGVRAQGDDASSEDREQSEVANQNLKDAGYNVDPKDADFEGKDSYKDAIVGELRDDEEHVLHVNIIKNLDEDSFPETQQGSDDDVIDLDASEIPVLLSVDQTDEDMYTITWRKDDNDLIVAQGDSESIKAILGDATHAALSDQEDAVTPIQTMEMNHEAYELFGSLERVESNVEDSTILAKSGKTIKTALWDTVVHLDKLAGGFNNKVLDMVLGTVDLVMLIGKVPGLSVDAMNYVNLKLEEQIKSIPEGVSHLVDELSKISEEDFDNFLDELGTDLKEGAKNTLKGTWSALKQLATDPETQGAAVFEVGSILLPFLKASKLGAAGRGAMAAEEVVQGARGGGATVTAAADRKVIIETERQVVNPVLAKGSIDDIVEGVSNKDAKLWSSNRMKDSVDNAYQHFKKHRAEFPEIENAKQYVEKAHEFIKNPSPNTLTKIRSNGEKMFYNPGTNVFAVSNVNGSPKTMFKPSNGMKYWEAQ